MSHLGERTDAAVDAIGRRLGEVGHSRVIESVAPHGLAALAAVLLRVFASVYGRERLIEDAAHLAVAVFEDNEDLWPFIDRRIAAGISRAVRQRMKAILYGG